MHEIYQDASGSYSFAWAANGAVPWHKLGQTVPIGSTREEWIRAAGYAWEIRQAPVEYQARLGDSLDTQVAIDQSLRVNYRSDTGAPLGVVSDGYKLVQPLEIFNFLWNVSEAAGLQPETAGVLRGGARFFVLAKNTASITIGQNDKTHLYACIATSADRSLATKCFWSAVRVVCANTLRIALNRARDGYSCSHRTEWEPEQAAQSLGLKDARESFETFAGKLTRLADRPCTPKEATDFFSQLLRPMDDVGPIVLDAPKPRELEKVRAIRGLDDLERSYYSAPGACPGTWYGALQGVTAFVDHVRGRDAGKRLDSALFSQGALLKTKAFDEACKRAQVN